MATEKRNINWFNVIVCIAIAILFFGLGKGCNRSDSFFGCNHKDTVKHITDVKIKKDSVKIIYVPTPYKVVEVRPLPIPGKPYPKIEYVYKDSKAGDYMPTACDDSLLWAAFWDFYATKYYDTTIRTARGGSVKISDTVTENSIKNRGVKIITQDSVIKETVVLREKKMILYFGLSALGNLNEPIHGLGAGFYLKGKNDKIIGAGMKVETGAKLFFEGSLLLPIRLRKN